MTRNNADFEEAADNAKLTLYRGLEDITHPNQIDVNKLGVHWTTDPNTAEEFAVPTWATEHDEITHVVGARITAEVDPKHIMRLDSPEMEGSKDWRMGPDHWEKEQTVRPGAPISIKKVEIIKHSNKTGETRRTSKRTFPTEGKA